MPGTECIALTTKFFASAVAQDHHDGKFDPIMLQIARMCVWCIYNRFFVKNRELRPDKNKFTFALGKFTTELAEIR